MDNQHTSNDNQQSTRDKQHSSRDNQHSTMDNQHTSNDNQHSSRDTKHSSRDNQHSTMDNQHTSNDNHHSSRDNPHSTIDNHHSSRDNPHSTIDNQHSSRDNQQTLIDNQYFSVDNQHSYISNNVTISSPVEIVASYDKVITNLDNQEIQRPVISNAARKRSLFRLNKESIYVKVDSLENEEPNHTDAPRFTHSNNSSFAVCKKDKNLIANESICNPQTRNQDIGNVNYLQPNIFFPNYITKDNNNLAQPDRKFAQSFESNSSVTTYMDLGSEYELHLGSASQDISPHSASNISSTVPLVYYSVTNTSHPKQYNFSYLPDSTAPVLTKRSNQSVSSSTGLFYYPKSQCDIDTYSDSSREGEYV